MILTPHARLLSFSLGYAAFVAEEQETSARFWRTTPTRGSRSVSAEPHTADQPAPARAGCTW